ncbi:MAG: fumarylacetoacetate hydrolase family protein [Gemmatales bacterium]|nr:fumarylacetoacetate hydrolase family protein [Gemmatales bacterium]MDW8385671.1 fumarylacetoacetate hydrolase family protein [Gemmatales bacterium]
MRLATVKSPSGIRLAASLGQQWVDLNATRPDLPTTLRQLLASGEAALHAVREAVRSPQAVTLPTVSMRFLPPVPEPQKIVCIGLNYRDHAAESGAPIPKEPILFSKYPTALIGHEESIVLPSVSNEVDYEAELVVVLGRRARRVSPQEGLEAVAGYTIGNDVSARDWQLKKDGKQWMVGKTFDTFAPCGPWLVTADEVGDPHRLGIRLRLNGQLMQSSNTDQMIFSVGELVSYLSRVFTLEPGDLIYTGTPPGVGFARKPPVFLKPGDVVEVEIDRLGLLRNPCVAET